ncbi:cupin-like domain-containing protein [Baffinella frigidus]|nr:cupin-like domain-containing protein [Cryptophyta sp. CCMP2293]
MPFENAYSGFTLKGAGEKEAAVPRVAVADISPKDFFKRFVAPRRPCILTGQLEGSNFAAWSNAYLKKKAGDSFVDVEHRESAKERYGKGKSQRIKFKDFMDKFAAKDDTLYMTTQELQNDAVGMPERMGNPAACLVGDFPARPALMGHLAPSTYTLWMGHNKEESSSGLHHDFHDNLYVLLRGTKRFRLFSPDDTDRMYTHGEVANVHPNGRICYKAHAMVEVASAEAAVQAGEKGAATRLEKAEAVPPPTSPLLS